MVLGVLLVVIGLVVSGCTGAKLDAQTKMKKGNSEGSVYIINREKFYQFQRPGKRWNKYGPDKFNDYWFIRDDGSTIYIGSLTSTESLSYVQHDWFDNMQKKYKWEDMKIVDERILWMGNAESPFFLKAEAFWSAIEYKTEGRTWKEKIYLVEGDKFYYRLRLSCPKRYFDRHLKEFEQLVKSFKILGETPGEPKDKKALGIVKRSPIKPEEETFERPRWRKGYEWTYRYGFSGEPYLRAWRKVEGKKNFEGTVCYVAKGSLRSRIKWYWTLDLNLKAFVSQGKIQIKCIPDHPLLDWPLQVGKTWEATYIYQERNREPETRKAEFKVVKKEKVEVPAGEFWALKIVEKVNGSIREEAWYSPKAKMFVKQKAYWIGKGVMTWELLEYRI